MGDKENSSEPIPGESMVDKGLSTFSDEFMDLNGGSMDFKAALLRKSHTEDDLTDDDVDLDEFEINDVDLPDDSSIPILRLSKQEHKELWKPWGDMKVIDAGNGYYAENVQRWKPNFDPLADKIGHMALWVHLPYLPFEYYNSSVLTRLGNLLGKTLKIDKTIEMANRGRFTRVCVEADVSKPLILKLIIGGQIQHVEYEGVGTICFHCGCIGHKDTDCDKMDKNAEDMNINNNPRSDGIHTETTNSNPASHFVKGNAFKVLDSIGNMEEQNMVSQDLPRTQRNPLNVATAGMGKSQGYKGLHSQGLSFNKNTLIFKRKRDRNQIELDKARI
ncbi:hypothetical protein FEM48_Zijuj03G0135000 [Ziziphus jujuba var. spinosa]|uniref:CCHC-type domain-containing protein n=1 Tax=Ziziphus jujuba var. spinosa TaxID=714518 RepID=A0A978VQK7_ZIZJJ|nr:hypothetical protein FEM48_Zijuj03G0135000 [Ziziphus jujuba var. spinosa]